MRKTTIRGVILSMAVLSALPGFIGPNALYAQGGKMPFRQIGTITPRHALEIVSNNWSIGTETMDRDYTIYANWKEFLGPLGFKKARIQAGWQKTEKRKGVYDWNWLDEIVFDMPKHGVEPWMVLCYGNTNYEGGGGFRLGDDIPRSPEALEAWDRWVRANVARYREVIDEWEIWNESTTAPDVYAEFLIRTSDAVRSVQPEAVILAFSMSFIKVERTRQVLSALNAKGRLDAIDQITYHPYYKRPEDAYPLVEELRTMVDSFQAGLVIRNGENGVPAVQHQGGVLREYPWSPVTQSKWLLRRLLGDLGRDIETSCFALMDMKYSFKWVDGKKDFSSGNYTMYTYGIVEANTDKTVKGPRPSYYAMQCLASVFDDRLRVIDNYPYSAATERSLSLFAFEHAHTGKQGVAFWFDGEIPSDNNRTTPVDLSFDLGNFSDPVLVDLRTGGVHEIPEKTREVNGTHWTFRKIPCYDSPVMIADRSLLKLATKERER